MKSVVLNALIMAFIIAVFCGCSIGAGAGYEAPPSVSEGGVFNDRIVCFGDSITWYDGRTFFPNHREFGQKAVGYESYLRESFGCVVMNMGVCGFRMPDILNMVRKFDYDGFGVVTLTAGTNDFMMPEEVEPLGEIAPKGSVFNTVTFCGALQQAIEHIQGADSSVRIVLITPIMGFEKKADGSLGRELPQAYADAIKEAGRLYDLPVCDWYYESGIDASTADKYLGDVVKEGYLLHPTNAGYKVMGEMLVEKLKKLDKSKELCMAVD